MLSWWTLWRVPALLAIVSAAWWFLYRPYAEEQGWVRVTDTFALCGERWTGADGCVVDGDTLVVGNGSARRRVRLVGFDAPELNGACDAEREQAKRARSALHEWLSRGPFEWNGEADPPRDQYGRELRKVRRNIGKGRHEYLAEVMIERGLAGESGWGTTPVDWCR
ncbi:thermonuclease family protein [Erythrobacter sp. THAF29]|uniref:thermonuclease family protein n=1 Tax=Erythrobacter sp. THAF29 TaxID=2587851 RepID=UPI001267BF79|nr:thermonuclease family protein [Erythrobacter sp. THAF29]QFT76652.1 hypothetical protein FIU90_03745 [Erythrobacter sp. THAF29]